MKLKTKIILFVAIILVIIQFIPLKKNISDINTISLSENIPNDVSSILKESCYDCHSNNTRYVWYMYIAPISFFTNLHIINGKKKLNFSEFNNYDLKKRVHKIEECIEEIEKDEMPLKSYLFLHKNASLDKDKKDILIKYFKSLLGENIE